jgi:hypothetical protein
VARRILVTGNSGTIGRHLSNFEELEFLAVTPRIDILSQRGPDQIIKKALEMNCQEILHLAWTSNSSPNYDSSKLHEVWQIQSSMLALKARETDLSISLVGTGLDTDPFSKSAYIREKSKLKVNVSKLIEEQEILWIRPFFVVDIPDKRPRIIRELIDSGPEGFAMRSGNSTQDYVLANDVANGIRCLLKNRISGQVDVGSGTLTRNIDLCGSVAKKFGFPLPTDQELDSTTTGPVADITLLTKLGWLPTKTAKLLGINS